MCIDLVQKQKGCGCCIVTRLNIEADAECKKVILIKQNILQGNRRFSVIHKLILQASRRNKHPLQRFISWGPRPRKSLQLTRLQ